MHFYAGIPLAAPDGGRVGALCVIDREVRHFDDEQMATLRDLAAIAGDELRARPAGRPAPEGWKYLYPAVYGKPESAITVRVSSFDGRMMLSVHNERPPIPEQELQQLFQPFERMENVSIQGWGLGLPFV